MLTKGLCAILFLSIFAIAISVIEPSKHLTVKEIVISGKSKISSSEIIKRSGIRAGETLMFFSSSDVEKKIMENPWISEINVKKFLHGKIEIEIFESVPFCILALEKTSPYYVDRKGKKLGQLEAARGLDFPVISGKGEISSELLLQAIKILDLSKSSSALSWSEISEVAVEKHFGIKLLTIDRRLINFGKDNMVSKWRKIEKIIVHARKRNLVEKSIDISSGEVGVINYGS